MIDSFYIYSKATEMVKQTGTRNPMKIASEVVLCSVIQRN